MESGRGSLPRSPDGLQTNSADILSNRKVDLWRKKNELLVLLPMSIVSYSTVTELYEGNTYDHGS